MSENWTERELFNAGWAPAELDWERHCEALAAAVADADMSGAATAAGAALSLARAEFDRGDPRLATAIANQAMCIAGRDMTAAGKLLHEARLGWNASGPWIEKMTAPRVARSSMFHMRMEQIHRDTYEENWRKKWNDIASSARRHLAGADLGAPSDADAARTGLEKWRRERPAMLNDTRKLMAAAGLLLPGLPQAA